MSSTPVRFTSGVTDRGLPHPLAQIGVLDRTRYIVFEDDFFVFGASGSGVTGWHLDESGTATGAAVQATEVGGAILAKAGGTAGNNFQYQLASNTTVMTPFKLAVNKKTALAARFKIEDADKNLFRVGLQNAQDDPWATASADSFLFRSNASAPATIEFIFGATAATQTTITLGAIDDATWVNAYAVFDGKKVWAALYTDAGAVIASGHAAAVEASIPNAALTVAFGNEAVDTGADDILLDHITVVSER